MFPDKTTVLIIKACAAGILLLCVWLHGHSRGEAGLADAKAAHQATKDYYAGVLADLAAKTRRAATMAEQAIKAAAIERQANDKRFDDAKRQADQAGRDLAAALHAGRERLQPWWAGSCLAAGQGDAAADAAETDPQRRADSAGRIAAAVREDAAVIEWLWNGWQTDRKAVIAGGCAVEAGQ